MKKSKLVILGSMVLIVISYLILYMPNDFNESYTSVRFRLGDSEYSEVINVKLDGTMKKDLLLHKTFIGTLEYDGVNILDEYDDVNEVIIDMDEQKSVFGSEIMMYRQGVAITKTDLSLIGNIVFSDDMSEIAISVAENGGWSSKDGVVIVGPATTKAEAKRIFKSFEVFQ